MCRIYIEGEERERDGKNKNRESRKSDNKSLLNFPVIEVCVPDTG